ncbi:MAG: hypothetical protein AB1817_19580 [Chloroflexota bacterium]
MPRPEHSEAYWAAMKYIIIALTGLMIVALILAVIVIFHFIPWS